MIGKKFNSNFHGGVCIKYLKDSSNAFSEKKKFFNKIIPDPISNDLFIEVDHWVRFSGPQFRTILKIHTFTPGPDQAVVQCAQSLQNMIILVSWIIRNMIILVSWIIRNIYRLSNIQDNSL